MLTYQVRPRVLRINGSTLPQLPAQGQVRFHLAPPQPFGMQAGGGRTAVKNAPASALFNANTGEHTVESSSPLQPLDVTIAAPDATVQLQGTTLTVSQVFDSIPALTQLIETVYFVVPALLTVDFGDPPIVERVDGNLGDVGFRWELEAWQGQLWITTQDQQEQAFATAWQRLSLLSTPGSRRLVAALHYFHVAVRLSRTATVAGEFLPEMILNLSKVLEVLFPSEGDGKSRDAVRHGLAQLAFSVEDIEADYLPAMALRNEIDVGHVDLSIFKRDQLDLIHGYVARAERAFRVLLSRLLGQVESGSYTVAPYDLKSAEGTALKIIERLQQHACRYAP